MAQIYQGRGEQGLGDQPYILEYKNGSQNLIFFGSVHSADPKNPQMAEIDAKWQQFIDNPNPNKQAFSEGYIRSVEGLDKAQAIKTHGESGLITWLATNAEVPVESPEPDRTKEIDYLKQAGYSYEQIITYYVARQMLQWVNYDKQNEPSWQKYLETTLSMYKKVHDWPGLDMSLTGAIKIFETESKMPFSVHTQTTLSKLSDPSHNPVSNASGRFRDQKLFEAIKDKWQAGFDVFVVYGSGHAIILEPALEKLTSQNWSEL